MSVLSPKSTPLGTTRFANLLTKRFQSAVPPMLVMPETVFRFATQALELRRSPERYAVASGLPEGTANRALADLSQHIAMTAGGRHFRISQEATELLVCLITLQGARTLDAPSDDPPSDSESPKEAANRFLAEPWSPFASTSSSGSIMRLLVQENSALKAAVKEQEALLKHLQATTSAKPQAADDSYPKSVPGADVWPATAKSPKSRTEPVPSLSPVLTSRS